MDQSENRFYREAPPVAGGPAFPQHGWTKDPEVLARMQQNGGMTLRDYFAAKAMHGICAHEDNWGLGSADEIAEKAYGLADAMLRARGEPCA